MSWLGWIIFGLIAGAIAKMLRPGSDPGGWLITIIIGILGSILGGFIADIIGFAKPDAFWSFSNWVFSIVGAIILLFIYSKLTTKN